MLSATKVTHQTLSSDAHIKRRVVQTAPRAILDKRRKFGDKTQTFGLAGQRARIDGIDVGLPVVEAFPKRSTVECRTLCRSIVGGRRTGLHIAYSIAVCVANAGRT